MKVGDLVMINRYRFKGEPCYAIIVGFNKDDDPIISYLGGDNTPHSVFRFNLEVLSSGQNLSED